MKTGTKSLLFGVHQVLWHPLTVFLAWMSLYGWPNWKDIICIIIHDWGYWQSPNMDGAEGEKHPEFAARLAGMLFGETYRDLCLLHSRHYSRQLIREPSKLCWADKLSALYEPTWFYLFRARLSGELFEYRKVAAEGGFFPLSSTDKEWFIWVRARLIKIGREQKGDAVPYVNPFRESEVK